MCMFTYTFLLKYALVCLLIFNLTFNLPKFLERSLLKNYSCYHGTISAILKDIFFPPCILLFNHTNLRYEEDFRVQQSHTAGRNGSFYICVWRMLRMNQGFANT